VNSAIFFITSALLLVITFVSGFGLRRAGRPRKTGSLTLHKLIALGAIILIALIVRMLGGAAGTDAVITGTVVLTGALYLVAIASGGWLSTTRPAPAAVAAVHMAAPPLAVLLTVVTVYLLANALG
jgi:hypothetical protein